jgi:hypothetical protein
MLPGLTCIPNAMVEALIVRQSHFVSLQTELSAKRKTDWMAERSDGLLQDKVFVEILRNRERRRSRQTTSVAELPSKGIRGENVVLFAVNVCRV